MLTDEQVSKIRELYYAGCTQMEIASAFKANQAVISHITSGKIRGDAPQSPAEVAQRKLSDERKAWRDAELAMVAAGRIEADNKEKELEARLRADHARLIADIRKTKHL